MIGRGAVLRGSFVAAALVATTPLLTGCPTRQCQAETTKFEGGDLVALPDGTYAYETSPLASPAEKWVSFDGQVTLHVIYPAAVSERLRSSGCTRVGDVAAWLGTSDRPNDDDGAVFTPNAGQTAEFTTVDTYGFYVTNGSCANYNARFRITYEPADGGTCALAPPSTSDAGGD